ncbi:hypothetical protein OG407_17475 [Streptomyces sp. NBC_01515]|uniref:hypothetical protein n=1 Tax=Streptomyces sp. NBC_01515 TaxID=2903890 RepID=UPI00386623D7
MCRGLAIATARARHVRALGIVVAVPVVPDRDKGAVIPAAPAIPPPCGAPLVFVVLVIRTPGVPVTVRDRVPGAVATFAPAIPPPRGAPLVLGAVGVFLVAARALVRGAVRLRVRVNSARVGVS